MACKKSGRDAHAEAGGHRCGIFQRLENGKKRFSNCLIRRVVDTGEAEQGRASIGEVES